MQIINNKYQITDTGFHFLFFICYLLFIISFCSCSSIVQKGGELLDAGSPSEMKFATYRSAAEDKSAMVELRELKRDEGRWVIEFSSRRWPGLTICAGMPSGRGDFELFEARILSSHIHGWNEFNLGIMGEGSFYNPVKRGGVLLIDEEVERIQISSGSIRLKSNRITGDAALTSLRNRRERILALTGWMASQTDNNGEKAVFQSKKDFEKYWKPLIFPELVLKSRRPPEYKADNAEWRRADSVKWNLTYTEGVFPEGLWEYRNSGAMMRDWEEALPWIYMEYSWDFIISSFNDTHLNMVN